MQRITHRLYSNLLPALTLCLIVSAVIHAQTIRVVNMIPNSRSNETNQDSEPNLAVNPANPLQIAGSAFTPDPMGGANAPIYISINGGTNWILNSIVPGNSALSGTGDITLRFGGNSNILYASTLRGGAGLTLNILRTSNFTLPTLMSLLVTRANVDQPYIQAATVMGGLGVGKDRAYVGLNDLSLTKNSGNNGQTSTVDQSLDAAATATVFTSDRVEARTTGMGILGQDGPQVRPATHPDGTVYAAFYGWRSGTFPTINTDIVVVRDDNWGTSATPFTALQQTGVPGVSVVQNVTFTWNGTLGQERLAGDLAIAVDPQNSSDVYVAWADLQAGVYTLHVRRSTNRGVNWSTTDLRTIPNAKNPGLAINNQGMVGFLYQEVKNQRWVTRLERTTNAFSTQTTITLADVPATTPAPSYSPYIGDYVHLMAVGKDFYGIFSANNTPDNANFPNGVTYQRNANFTTKTLLDANNNTVPISIDPFFFKIGFAPAPADDFYVRDWTNSPTSGDDGVEPSINPVFYTTSDVWNRRSNASGGFNANDQPQNETPWSVNLGNNFAFARVRRNAIGTTAAVNAHFLYSEFGTGSNFQNAATTADPVFNFGAGALVQTMPTGYQWQLPVTTSTHLCLAVEVSTVNDAFIPPSLLGFAPGWPTTDLKVIDDNNKAQRNMGVYPLAQCSLCQVTYYAVAHNAATFQRNMILKYEAPKEVPGKLRGLSVEVVGGRSKPFRSGDTITLANMQPGENRWIGLTFTGPGDSEALLPVTFSEMVDGVAVNGFAIAVKAAPIKTVIQGNLEFHGAVFARMAAAFGSDKAPAEVLSAQQFLREDKDYEKHYGRFLQSHMNSLAASVPELLKSQGAADTFGAINELHNLSAAAQSGDLARAAAAHAAFLHKLDAALTMLQKSKGDVADILQTVRWQNDLYARSPQLAKLPCASLLRKQSQEFILAYGARKVGNDDYPKLVRALLGCFRETAKALANTNVRLVQDIANLERNLSSPVALQRAHRNYLLNIQSLAK